MAHPPSHCRNQVVSHHAAAAWRATNPVDRHKRVAQDSVGVGAHGRAHRRSSNYKPAHLSGQHGPLFQVSVSVFSVRNGGLGQLVLHDGLSSRDCLPSGVGRQMAGYFLRICERSCSQRGPDVAGPRCKGTGVCHGRFVEPAVVHCAVLWKGIAGRSRDRELPDCEARERIPGARRASGVGRRGNRGADGVELGLSEDRVVGVERQRRHRSDAPAGPAMVRSQKAIARLLHLHGHPPGRPTGEFGACRGRGRGRGPDSVAGVSSGHVWRQSRDQTAVVIHAQGNSPVDAAAGWNPRHQPGAGVLLPRG
eukprot:3787700-Rhodomonas_salina.2